MTELLIGHPVVPNPVEEVEQEIRRDAIASAKRTLNKLVALLDSADNSVQRVLHLIEDTSESYQRMLATLGTPAVVRHRKFGGVQIASEGNYMTNTEPILDGETFGAQAVQQLVAGFKDIVGGSKGTPEPRRLGWEIESLTRALATAKTAELDDVVGKIKERLGRVLVEAATEPLVAEPALPIAPMQVGLAAGVSAGATIGTAALQASDDQGGDQ